MGRIETSVVAKAVFGMISCRLGSLNALEKTAFAKVWRRWLGAPMPSADTLGRVPALMDPDQWRKAIRSFYSTLKRNKAFPPRFGGLVAAVVDGHEFHATYNQCCFGCLTREVSVKTSNGVIKRIQYYHRNVTVSLIGEDFDLLLDAEPVFAGEDEVAAALRLLRRVLTDYPRAFDVVLGDALYADPRFFRLLMSAGKDAMAVLKNERRKLVEDALRMFQDIPPLVYARGRTECEVWDMEGFATWPQVADGVRVIRSREKRLVKRQLSRRNEEQTVEWLWVTTLSSDRIDTKTMVDFGHARWNIENQGFNELVSRWSADHVYKHDPVAMLNFWLATLLAHNLFMAFYHRNLKPIVQARLAATDIARMLAAEVFVGLLADIQRRPP